MAKPNSYGGLSLFAMVAGVFGGIILILGIFGAVTSFGSEPALGVGILVGSVAASILYFALGDFARLMIDVESHLNNISDFVDDQAVKDVTEVTERTDADRTWQEDGRPSPDVLRKPDA